VNPGNYVDKKKFEQLEYTDAEYAVEIERIRDRFTPLVNICKEHGTAMRIGTNHGGTMQNSKELMMDMDAWKWKYVQQEEDACTQEILSNNHCIFLHSKKAHNDVITNNNNFERFLKAL
jgi:4-hydroxy-3-methylbut-2-en-1-yl diphosphate synthase IspG/GcpE